MSVMPFDGRERPGSSEDEGAKVKSEREWREERHDERMTFESEGVLLRNERGDLLTADS